MLGLLWPTPLLFNNNWSKLNNITNIGNDSMHKCQIILWFRIYVNLGCFKSSVAHLVLEVRRDGENKRWAWEAFKKKIPG